MPLHFG